MPNELTFKASIVASKDSATMNCGYDSKTVDLTGSGMGQLTQLITTADVQLSVPADVNPIGNMIIKNTDGANYVELSYGTGVNFDTSKFAKIRAGFPFFGQPTSNTIYARANTASVRIQSGFVSQ